MNMIAVVGGESFTDIDVLACAIAYAELLGLEGKKAEAVIPGPLNASCPPMIRDLAKGYRVAPSDKDAVYAVVDISELAYIARCASVERIVEIYDHRVGFQDFWKEKLGQNSHIELVGACATLIWEEFKKRGHAEKISTASADLLAAAILSNTLNFGAQITHQRDRDAFAELKRYIDLPSGWEARYFDEVQHDSLEGNLEATIKNDTKIMNVPGLSYKIVMGQMELWDGKGFISDHQSQIIGALEGYGYEDWFMSVPSISEGINYLYCTSERLKKLLRSILDAKFNGNTGFTEKMWLRKEVRKKLLEMK